MKSRNQNAKLRLAVVGSRSITDFVILEKYGLGALRTMGFEIDDVEEIVSGLAQGADMLGVDLSLKYRIPYLGYVPVWVNSDGSKNMKAGKERNTYIVDDSDAAIVLWDGWSKGTADTLAKLSKKRKPYILIEVDYIFLDKKRTKTEFVVGGTFFANVDEWDRMYEAKKAGTIRSRRNSLPASRKR